VPGNLPETVAGNGGDNPVEIDFPNSKILAVGDVDIADEQTQTNNLMNGL
jgi:hypothetical protein